MDKWFILEIIKIECCRHGCFTLLIMYNLHFYNFKTVRSVELASYFFNVWIQKTCIRIQVMHWNQARLGYLCVTDTCVGALHVKFDKCSYSVWSTEPFKPPFIFLNVNKVYTTEVDFLLAYKMVPVNITFGTTAQFSCMYPLDNKWLQTTSLRLIEILVHTWVYIQKCSITMTSSRLTI